ncbi:hypothetical protein [Planomonospora venezuelensis]|uniref:Uncharacterized protein n=1 Tax=Planomonospora venezuelensis TaxID=1999 RepID=A0A841DK69_PLAVE|nr:hypothetical protein [Planomonospora venezuelensis]MBB5967516.1 hypothetical protein [Planomonospora venezuelensis]GIN04814.1 hypothetical protein Pve01_64720 [Planomonospora venezuelensis]
MDVPDHRAEQDDPAETMAVDGRIQHCRACPPAGSGTPVPCCAGLESWWRLDEHQRADISAELRNAIAAIYAASENLLDLPLPASLHEQLLAVIHKRAAQLRELLEGTAWAGL